MNTKHYSRDRRRREKVIKQIGEGQPYKEFVIDRGHKDGAELHVITTNAIIIVYNAINHKLITKMIARPNQIKRYFLDGNYPMEIVEIEAQHKRMQLNHA